MGVLFPNEKYLILINENFFLKSEKNAAGYFPIPVTRSGTADAATSVIKFNDGEKPI